jgi:phosphate transport system protein
LDRSLEEVRDNLLRLASMVDSAIARDMRALVERDCDLAQQVSNDDALLNGVRYKIEAQAYAIIATQQPNGPDLRAAVAAVGVATNLERMGDHGAGIARLVLRLCNQPPLKSAADLPAMAEIARQMMRGSVDAYLRRDRELAQQVANKDTLINRLHDQFYRELLDCMTRDASAIERATFLLWISHGLERIGDRSKNICERAIYLATGELVEFGDHPS